MSEVVLALDDVGQAHQSALELALDACERGETVAHLHADPTNQSITFGADGSHDLGNAVTSIPTADGRLIKVSIGGLTRTQVAEVVASVQPAVDRIFLSGPDVALTQLSLELATLADSAVIVGGSATEVEHLTSVLDQLGVRHQPTQATHKPTRRITPPGRV